MAVDMFVFYNLMFVFLSLTNFVKLIQSYGFRAKAVQLPISDRPAC